MPLPFELPGGFILKMDGLARGQKSLLGFHSKSLYRIPFGFEKRKKIDELHWNHSLLCVGEDLNMYDW